ncbi:uncharacterized protein LOC128397806 [Panonychus citri]|uniref:uncharacterized protein LOC128397806 n=1 Tax=Panonychus citri TaxID=50023 RepID=UPI0023077940|nr:uncharacterized protein LOC128397806 [Panonychus citri]XP_053214533.1 uncharacterized protein LOC128397806 [Panonychus citri]
MNETLETINMKVNKNQNQLICLLFRLITIQQNALQQKSTNQSVNCDIFAYIVIGLLISLLINLIILSLRLILPIDSEFDHSIELIRTIICIVQLIIICRQRSYWINLYALLINHNFNANFQSKYIYFIFSLIVTIILIIDGSSWFADKSDNYNSIDNCFDFFFFPSNRIDYFHLSYEVKFTLVLIAILYYGLIVHGIQLITINWIIYICYLTSSSLTNHLQYLQFNLVNGKLISLDSNQIKKERLFRIRLIVNRIDKLRRQLDDSLDWLPFVWILAHLFESFSCLIEYLITSNGQSTNHTQVIHLTIFLRRWSLFSLSSVFMIILCLVTIKVKSNYLNLEQRIATQNHQINSQLTRLSSNGITDLEEILFKQELSRWRQQLMERQSTKGTNQINQSLMALLINTIIPMFIILKT